jgi:hypothetical protein
MKTKENTGDNGAGLAYNPCLDKYAGKSSNTGKPGFVKTHKATIIASVQKNRANSHNKK